MAKAKEAGKGDEKKSRFKDVQRGTQDEMQVLALILAQNIPLRTVVLDRLRVAAKRAAAAQEGALKKSAAKLD